MKERDKERFKELALYFGAGLFLGVAAVSLVFQILDTAAQIVRG